MIKVTAVDSKELSSSKTFDVEVNSPKSLINATLVTMKNSVGRIEAQTAEFDLFSQQSIKSILGVDNATKEITKIETRFNASRKQKQITIR